jgi:hypothetical protein
MSKEQKLPELVVTRGDGIPLPDQKAALEEFKRQCAAPGTLPGDREAFGMTLERHMHAMVRELDDLIDLHQRWGDTLQKTYLYRARAALKDGLDWFGWERKRAAEKRT